MSLGTLKKVGIVLGLALMLGEAALRFLVHEDADGGLYLGNRRLRPYAFPSSSIRHLLDSYREESGRIEWCSSLGWKPRCGSTTGDGRYAYDDQGLRVASASAGVKERKDGLRIAMFGDSFMHSSDVDFESSLGYLLEQELRSHGVASDVLNLGVPGYGMDQALLRYEEIGDELDADVVVFGLQFENSSRNMNVCRAFLSKGSGIPYTKPRFVLDHGDLELRNYPTPSPDELVGIYSDIESWDGLQHETYYQAADYQRSLLHKSYLYTVVDHALGQGQRPNLDFSPGSERVELVLAILSRFQDIASARGHRLVVLHFPIGPFIDERIVQGAWPYREVLEMVDARWELVDPGPLLLELAREDRGSISVDGSAHYSPLTNKTIAEYLTERFL